MSEADDDCEWVSVEVAQEPAARILGFAPLQLSDDIYNIVNDNLGTLVNKFGERLMERHNLKLKSYQVEKLLNVFKRKLQAQQDHLYDEFDKYLVGDVLAVHPNVVLEEDRCQLEYSETREKLTAERIETYTKRLIALNACKAQLTNMSSELTVLLELTSKLKRYLTETAPACFGVESVNELCNLIRRRTKAVLQICLDSSGTS
ncbi:unnamed protein product [Dicrocoelium dendriticum]|nr:unnamed protein product [Dicrocoelium dendriticum]